MSSGEPTRGADTVRLAGYVLVLGGAAWLLAAVGFVPDRFVRAGALLWPLIAIGLGLDVWGIRRPPAGVPYSLLALLVVALAGLFFPATRPLDAGVSEPPPGSTSIAEPLGSANRAEIALELGPTSVLVRAGASEGLLLEGTAFGAARLDLDAGGRAVRRLDVAVRGPTGDVGAATAPEPADAELRVTDRIPLALSVRGGGRATTLDLSRLDLEGVRYTGSTGPASITLGGVGPERFDAHVIGGAGPLDVVVPEGSRLNLRLEAGPGGAALSVGARSDLAVVLRGGAGPIAVTLPADARIRIVVEDPQGGIVSIPDRVRRMEGEASGDPFDVYQTAGFREVVPTIQLRIEEVGPGPIAIR